MFVWLPSLYIAALEHGNSPPYYQAQAGWDAFGELLKEANRQSIQVHVWYSPWQNKWTNASVELIDHPEWVAVDADGASTDSQGSICLARPEVRQYELNMITSIMDRYPNISGIHLEEPNILSSSYCYCTYCRQQALTWYGFDIRTNIAKYTPILQNLTAAMCSEFVARLRNKMRTDYPWISLSANGGYAGTNEWQTGCDWMVWADRGYLDFYVPKIFTSDVSSFTGYANQALSGLHSCSIVPGIGVSYSDGTNSASTIANEIAVCRQLSSRGFVLFRYDYFTPELLAALRNL
ncbi:MAG: family 10 glycosylhydrolase [Verrucomicrobia bacterium]|nr:family 10 glycosylhydrolase [Verrucomicrobiota bacterium]